MKDRDIENRLATYVQQTTPDVLDSVLQQCDEQEGRVLPMSSIQKINHHPKKRTWRIALSAAAAVFILATGLIMGYQYQSLHRVDSIVEIDVNPSIELKINRQEKILSATPLNTDADVILDGMDLKGVDLDIALNALIGSMLKNGYVNELRNSVLISVENEDEAKSAALSQRLTEEVNKLLADSSIQGAVLSQTLTGTEDLEQLAQTYGISLGKAAVIQLLVEQDPSLTFEDMANLSINDLNLLLSSKNADLNKITSVGDASSGAYIGEEKAKSIAVEHAQVSLSEAAFQKVELDYEDGRVVYEVEFSSAGTDYEYEIDAAEGTVLKYEREQKRTANSTNSSTSQSYIGEEDAKMKALTHAGLSSSDVQFVKAELDIDDGKAHYDVEFYSGTTEYDYEVDAYDGTILKFDADVENFTIPTNDSSASYLGDAKAKAAALQHANLSEGDVTFTKVKLDHDDGRMIYDVEFYSSSGDYEYEIDAFSGAILEWDCDAKHSGQNDASSPDYISQDQAKSIALEKAGLSDSAVTFYKVNLDYDDGRALYELEFKSGSMEYEAEIDAVSGAILDWDSERDDD
ncbi:PepSY domain-containing protein [Bianquea renquensis]|jgi:hypothetical protein|uniref:PepSY domain-containing protein n=1 Tax=Bianquea renquensis TaxID=2763661 RepID=A0A926DUK5_9FIRM|nr:PepSY domain-containing protein [Bianquea renquensis]MBC8544361.1 PepSY domain-containing protein [Bianquea renquensis]